MNIIEAKELKYSYTVEEEKKYALNGVNISVKQSEFVCILGHNGSGKSTFAKHINVLLKTQEGELTVCGFDTANIDNVWEIRKNAGMVFQNPDNQIVSTIVEEDVAFGPENLGVPYEEIHERVVSSLKAVNMTGFEKNAPHMLSGGQKQRIAIAGVLAMYPEIIVFDEPTAMLDPQGRTEVMQTIRKLNKEGKTVVLITHFMEEAINADKVFVMNKGEVLCEGTPQEVFANSNKLTKSGLVPPMPTFIYEELKKNGIVLESCPISDVQLLNLLKKRSHKEKFNYSVAVNEENHKEVMLELKNISYTYMPGTPFCVQALKDINLKINRGEFIGIIGHTGCGKSTLIQIIAGLIEADSGNVLLEGEDINKKGYDRKILRRKVGVVFQFPEYQLFEETVAKDVAFGPTKAGMNDIDELVKNALEIVGFDYEQIKDLSPFDLSGGQKRKAAIAGVLATSPKLLILDEPISGLDPLARDRLMELVKSLNNKGTTIIMISHNMEGLCQYANRIIALNKGEMVFDGKAREIFSDIDKLEKIGLLSSETKMFCKLLEESGIAVPSDIINPHELLDFLTEIYGGASC